MLDMYILSLKDTRSWKEGYVPATTTYINQSRWNDPVEETIKVRNAWDNAK